MMRKAYPAMVMLALVFAFGRPLVNASASSECTPEQGQDLINEGRYAQAIQKFKCVIDAHPTEVEGYRGRIEAELLSGLFSDAVGDYTLLNAYVLPVHPDAAGTIFAGYAARLAVAPENIPALTGASFANWWFFAYPEAIRLLNELLAVSPDDVYGNLFRGSSRLLSSSNRARGIKDLDRAIELAEESPDVHFVVADAYTYGLSDPERAFAEATLALNGGLDTPRIHAILAGAYLAFGDLEAAASEIQQHIDLVTTELLATGPLTNGDSVTLDFVPGRTYEIPVPAIVGEILSITTHSNDFSDSIMVLLAPDGPPVVGSDDQRVYLAGIKWAAEVTGIYRLQVTSFESASTGEMAVTRH
jgi:tetratricopeptide (TPR) repeat protein